MLEELNKDAALPENLKSLVTNGLSAGRRLTAMVNDLLDVSKIEEGRFGYQFDNVEIISFVEQALSGAAALAQEYGIKIYFDKPAEPSIVCGLTSKNRDGSFQSAGQRHKVQHQKRGGDGEN